jgi:hypothetical protein
MMNPKEYRQPRCPHGWVDVTQCEPCKTAAERDALQNEIDHLRSALAQQGDEYQRGFSDGMKEAPTGECWIRVIDEAMVGAHLGVADIADDYGTAKEKLNDLICWSVEVDRDTATPAPQALAQQVSWQPIETAPKYESILIYQPKFRRTTLVINDGFEWKHATHWMPLPPAPDAAAPAPQPVVKTPPEWWPAVENILNEYGLDAVSFVADFKKASGDYPAQIKQDISAPQAQQPIIQTQIVKDISEKPCHSCAHHD